GLAICTDGSEWLTCSVRYRPAGGDAAQNQARVVGRADHTAEPSTDWRLAAAVAECAMVLRQSPHAGTATFQSARELVDAADSEERAEFARLLDALALRSREPAAASPYADGGRINR
ncbi:YfbK domain-containing protein, partial [Gordonibacter pamelaeae]